MVDLDDAGDPVGDDLRDRMDAIWLALSNEDRAWLDCRNGNASLFAGSVARRDLTVREDVRARFRRAAA